MFFIYVYRYPEVLFDRHVLLFETNDLKQGPFINFYLHNTSTEVKAQCKYKSSKMKLPYTKDITERL